MTKHLTLLLFIGLAWGQQASSEKHFKERGISKLKTTNKNFGSGSIIKANDNQIRFVTKPNSLQQILYRGLLLSYSGKEYLIDIKSIEEITHNPENYGKLLRTTSNLFIPGTYCFTLLVNIWSETAHIEALIMTMIPVVVRGLFVSSLIIVIHYLSKVGHKRWDTPI